MDDPASAPVGAPATAAGTAGQTVAVVGSSTVLGAAVLHRLARSGARVLAIDADGPDMPPGEVEVRLMDPRDKLLPLALEGVDTVVHAAFAEDLSASSDALYGHNVGGTRNILDAADKAGVRRLVVASTAVAYGAHHDNPVPLREHAPLRANPGFAYAHHRMLAEEMVEGWAADHPSAAVTVLRVAPLLAPGVGGPMAALLTGPRLLVPAGGAPLWQFAHPDDVAEAVGLVLAEGLVGTFNVAADGWMTTAEVAALLGRKVLSVGQTTMAEVLRRAHAVGLSPAPAEALPYLLHPWVVDVAALRDHGWRPRHTNRDLVSEFGEATASAVAVGTLTLPRRTLRRAGLSAAGLVALAGWLLVRRARR